MLHLNPNDLVIRLRTPVENGGVGDIRFPILADKTGEIAENYGVLDVSLKTSLTEIGSTFCLCSCHDLKFFVTGRKVCCSSQHIHN